MKELYLISALLLGGVATYSTFFVVKHKYVSQDLPSSDFVPALREQAKTPEPVPIPPDVIYEKNAFDIRRGVVVESPTDENTEEPVETQGSYSFEFRGIINIGKTPIALFSSKLNSRRSVTRGRTSPRGAIGAAAQKIYNCRVGDKIGESNYTVQAIENGTVDIADNRGNEKSFTFTLTSAESIKRSEQAFKTEEIRQKSFARQNSFNPTKATQPTRTKPPTPKKTDPAKAAKKSEEVRKNRAEKLKEEMQRLKKLREAKQKENTNNEQNAD